ncbi:MAG: energy transducer TonB, partial [Betaproteobacteria bacterium]|nr:energy transducer TonB [Betaproteobacteria bacterium]
MGAQRLPMPATAARLDASTRNLSLAVGLSVLIHGLLLSLHFKFPDASRALQDKAMEIILVNSKSASRPSNAQALAQANLDGGGNTEENRRASTPLPPSARQQAGADLEQAQQRVQALEAQQQKLLTEVRSKTKAPVQQARQPQPQPSPTLSGRDLASSALAMARLEGEINRNVEDYNKRPRKKFLGTRAEEYRFAQYMEDWRLKVERVGTLNYPEPARGKLYGSLVLTVVINADGSIDKVELERSSGQKVLDDAALRIVKMAAPYAAFPADIRREVDQLVITRTWFF